MKTIKVIITGATGMVGEGVLIECLQNERVSEVLMVNRRHFEMNHSKLKELLVPDFLMIESFAEQLKGYDACFFCAGISSIGMKEEKYTRITFDTTIHFAKIFSAASPNSVFTYVSGQLTDSSEKGKMMWARVKSRTENSLMKMPFRGQYNFRPGVMKHFKGQKNVPGFFKPFIAIYSVLFPKKVLTLQEVGQAMINSVTEGFSKQVLEIRDIRTLAKL